MDSWGYLSGLLRAEQIHTLTDNDFNTYAESKDINTLSKSFEDTKYGVLFQGQSLRNFANIFDNYLKQKMQEIKEMLPSSIIMDVHASKIDLNNLKLCYKAKLKNKKISWEDLSEEGTITPEHMFTIIEYELWNELPSIVADVLIQLNDNSNNNIRKVDFLIDKAYYTYHLNILKQANKSQIGLYKELIDFYKREIDCENIKNIFRAKTMSLEKEDLVLILISGGYIDPGFYIDQANLSPEDLVDLVRDTAYGEVLSEGIDLWASNKSCTILEKQIDEYSLDVVKNFAFLSEGPAVVEETIRTLQIELKNLKLIIIGKLNNMSTEEIKGRIRYVR